MQIEVTGCHMCPMYYNDEWGYWCQHPKYGTRNGKEVEYFHTDIPSPSWCPLKEESLTLFYAKKDGNE